jgi:ribosomal protein S12 methylthiotransferase accessory factor YcaO
MNQFLPVPRKSERSISDDRYLKPATNLPPVEFNHEKGRSGDIATCVQLAKDRGMEIFVLDQTRADVGLRVAKVIVPGMRQLWKRFAPGRLFEIPVRLGWLASLLTENQLNPTRFLN